MKLVHWPLKVGCYIWYSDEGTERGSRCTKCKSPPSMASVTITVLLYNGPMLCSFNVTNKVLNIEQSNSNRTF